MLGIFGRSEKPYLPFCLRRIQGGRQPRSGPGSTTSFLRDPDPLERSRPKTDKVWADKYPVVIEGDAEKSKAKRVRGCELAMGLPELALKPGDQKTSLTYDLYIGPKDSSSHSPGSRWR